MLDGDKSPSVGGIRIKRSMPLNMDCTFAGIKSFSASDELSRLGVEPKVVIGLITPSWVPVKISASTRNGLSPNNLSIPFPTASTIFASQT